MVNNFQRAGSTSNSHVGANFEAIAQEFFACRGVSLRRSYGVPVGMSSKKERKFDLGSDDPPVLVECKSHTWTSGGNVPSARITVWNEAMYYFFLTPEEYRKVLFVLRDFNEKREETLAQYYLKNYAHMIPEDVEILEYDGEDSAERLR